MMSGTATLAIVIPVANVMLDISAVTVMSRPWVLPNPGVPALTAWEVNFYHHQLNPCAFKRFNLGPCFGVPGCNVARLEPSPIAPDQWETSVRIIDS